MLVKQCHKPSIRIHGTIHSFVVILVQFMVDPIASLHIRVSQTDYVRNGFCFSASGECYDVCYAVTPKASFRGSSVIQDGPPRLRALLRSVALDFCG